MPNVSSCQRPGLQNVMLLHLAEKAGLGIQQNIHVCVCVCASMFVCSWMCCSLYWSDGLCLLAVMESD